MRSQSNFLLNFFSLNASSLIIKILNFFLFLFLVRTLSVQEYGIYALIWAQVNFFTPLLDFGTTSYGLVYMIEEKKKELNSLLSLRFVISILIFCVTILSGLLYREESIALYVFLTSFAIFGNVMYGSLVILMSLRQKAYIASAFSLLFTILIVSISILVLLTTQSLLWVFVTTCVLYNLNAIVSWAIIQKVHKGYIFAIDTKFWKEIISKSYVFVLISFFLGIYFKIDIFLLKILKSEIEVGIYSAGYKFFESLLFIIGSYNITATPQLAKLYKENVHHFLVKIKKDSLFLFFLGAIITLVTYIIAPLLLSLVLKEGAGAAARVLQIVILSLPLMLLSIVFTNGLYILGKAHIIIVVYFFQILINVVLNVVFIPKYSYIASAYITVFNEALNAIVLFMLFNYLKKNENRS